MILQLFLFTIILIPKNIELYYNGAVVDYIAPVSLKVGFNEVYLTGIPEGATFLSAKGDENVSITGFNMVDSIPHPSRYLERIESVYDSLKEIYEILSWTQRIIQAEKNMLERLISSACADSAILKGINLSSFLDEVKRKGVELTKEEKRLDRRLRSLSHRLKAFEDSIKSIKGPALHLSIFAEKTGKYRLYIRLFTSRITYVPEYSLNALPDEDIVVLRSFAKIRNNLETPFNNVRISLLLQDFSYRGIVDIQPEKYYYDRPPVYETKFSNTAYLMAPRSSFEKGGSLPPKPDVQTYVIGQKFSLPLKYTLAAKKLQSFSIYTDTLKARFLRKAYPRLYKGVWLYATIKNNKFPIYLKDVRMFIDGVYQGTWSSKGREIVYRQDTFSANFGNDKGMEIKREVVQDFEEQSWLGSRVRKYEFKITVKNNHRHKARLILYDNLPLFHSDMFSLEHVKITPQGYVVDKESRVIKWETEILPHEKKIFKLYYEVKKKK